MARSIKDITDEEIIEACENSLSMAEASRKLDLSFTTFRRHAMRLGVYETNQTGVGIQKKACIQIPTEDILVENSTYQNRVRLKNRLIREGLLENCCAECGIGDVWNGKPLALHLDHINGVNNDNRIENLRLLCPNCHSQTETYAGKNVGKNKK
jgi:5-methylcytosine-specific restriction endonuclease McrA